MYGVDNHILHSHCETIALSMRVLSYLCLLSIMYVDYYPLFIVYLIRESK